MGDNVGGSFNLGSAYASVVIRTDGIEAALRTVKQQLDQSAQGITGTLRAIGSGVSEIGGGLTTLFTPLSAGLYKATSQFNDFNEAITNIRAVAGLTAEETQKLSDTLLTIGEHSREGPQAIAEAFYDIAGGVVDASSRMATLQAAVAAAEAGNASLTGTTKALISVMNGYGFSADKATFATDVMTKTVGVGVGTMDELASALPNVAGLANSVGISFDNLGAMMAYISTKGVTFNEAGTQISSMLTMLLKPTDDMKDALERIGFSSGRAAVEQLGLIGTLKKLKDAGYDVETLGGRIEAMRGIIALTGQGADEFLNNFNNGLQGLTEATQKIQNASPAAQLDFFNSAMATLSITIGQSLAPALSRLLAQVLPIIDAVLAWVRANPELVGQIGMLVLGLGAAGPIIWGIGKAIGAVSSILGGLGTLIGVILSPVGLLIGAAFLLYQAFQTNFGGIRDFLEPIFNNIKIGFETLVGVIGNFSNTVKNFGIGEGIASIINAFMQMAGVVKNDEMSPAAQKMGNNIVDTFIRIQKIVQPFVDTFANGIRSIGVVINGLFGILSGDNVGGFTNIADYIFGKDGQSGGLQYILQAFGMAGDSAANFADGLRQTLQGISDFVQNTVLPALTILADWFLNDALPAIIGFVTGTVVPAFQSFFGFLGDVWAVVGPHLERLANWFLTEAMPAILNFITDVVIPGIGQFINFLTGIWDTVSPYLVALADWFLNTALPAVVNFITTQVIPRINEFATTLSNIWATVQPYLQQLYDWFLNTALPAVVNFITTQVIPRINEFATTISNIWTTVQPYLQYLYDWFVTAALPAINNALTWFKDNIVQPVIDLLTGIWNTVSPTLDVFLKWFQTDGLPLINTALNDFKTNVIQPVIDKLSGWWTSIQPGIDSLKTNLQTAWNWINDNILTPAKNWIQGVIDKINQLKDAFTGGVGAWQGAGQNAQTAAGMVASGQASAGDFIAAFGTALAQEFHIGDYTGLHPGNMAYMVGTGAQPQLFAPKQDMIGIPNIDKLLAGGKGGPTVNGPFYITANNEAEGREAARGFKEELAELLEGRGNP